MVGWKNSLPHPAAAAAHSTWAGRERGAGGITGVGGVGGMGGGGGGRGLHSSTFQLSLGSFCH